MLAETTGAALLHGLLRRYNAKNVRARTPERRAAKRSLNRMDEAYKTVAKSRDL